MFTEKSKNIHQEKQSDNLAATQRYFYTKIQNISPRNPNKSDNLASCSYTEIFNLLFFLLFDAQQYVESALQLSIVQF